MTKSPFLIFQHFLSQDECDAIATKVRVKPDLDTEGYEIAMMRNEHTQENVIFERFKQHIPLIEEHYNLKYKSAETVQFHQFPITNGSKLAEMPYCDNAAYKRKKWVRVNSRDLTCLLWLKDYQDQPPFDMQHHVYGGKHEFPIYNFSFQPQAGTLVVFPSNERFIQATTPILVGELQLAKFWIHGQGIWLYNPAEFPGDYRTWFNDVV